MKLLLCAVYSEVLQTILPPSKYIWYNFAIIGLPSVAGFRRSVMLIKLPETCLLCVLAWQRQQQKYEIFFHLLQKSNHSSKVGVSVFAPYCFTLNFALKFRELHKGWTNDIFAEKWKNNKSSVNSKLHCRLSLFLWYSIEEACFLPKAGAASASSEWLQ